MAEIFGSSDSDLGNKSFLYPIHFSDPNFLFLIANNLCMCFVLDGYSYEKEAMENWISKKKRTSPMTNLLLSSAVLIPNRTLKMAINRWLETHQK